MLLLGRSCLGISSLYFSLFSFFLCSFLCLSLSFLDLKLGFSGGSFLVPESVGLRILESVLVVVAALSGKGVVLGQGGGCGEAH